MAEARVRRDRTARPRLLDGWWVAAILGGGLLLAYGWSFLQDPTLVAPTRDPAWYTWRAELLQHADPGELVREWGPAHVFSGGYRVTVPLLGALLQRVAGMERFTWTALVAVAVPVCASLALGAFAYRYRRDPLAFVLTALAAAGLFLTVPFLGYMDNVVCLFLLATALPFVGPARTSWGARAALGLMVFLAALTHPTTMGIFVLVLAAGAFVRLVATRSLRETVRADGPALAAAGVGAVLGLGMWVIGAWGPSASFAEAAVPPPYPASFFRDRLGQWLGSMHLAVLGPLLAVALATLAVVAVRRRRPLDDDERLSLLWALPLIGLLGFVVGLTYPYYRFLNTTLAPMLLAGLGAWLVATWVLRVRPAALGVVGVLAVVAALGYALSLGLRSWNRPEAAERWLQPEMRIAAASVERYASLVPPDTPLVFVIDAPDNRKAYGWAKTFTNVSRAMLTGDQALRSYAYFGDVRRFFGLLPTRRTDPIYNETAQRFLRELKRGLRSYDAPPLVFLVASSNRGTRNAHALERGPTRFFPEASAFVVISRAEHPLAAVVAGPFTLPEDEPVRDALAAGRQEAAALAHHEGLLADPLHLLRVLAGLLALAVLPGALAARWFGLRTGIERVALIPGLSLGVVLLAGFVVLGVTRAPLAAGSAWASVAAAVAVAAGLHVVARRRGEPASDAATGSG